MKINIRPGITLTLYPLVCIISIRYTYTNLLLTSFMTDGGRQGWVKNTERHHYFSYHGCCKNQLPEPTI